MKGKILILLAALALMAFPAWGATKISDLPAATTLTGSEALAGVQSGATVKVTPAQIATYTATTYTKGVYVLCASAATGMSVTGTTSETTLATCTVPANAMGANGVLRITAVWSNNNSANTKSFRVKFPGTSGTNYLTLNTTTNISHRMQAQIANRNATNSQVGMSASTSQTGWASSSVALATSTADTTADQDVSFRAQLANGSDTATLESLLVELIRP